MHLLVSGSRCHLLVVLQESLKSLFGLLVLNSSLLLFFLLCLDFVGIECLLLLTQFWKSTVVIRKGKNLGSDEVKVLDYCFIVNSTNQSLKNILPVARIIDNHFHGLFPRRV